MEELKKKVIDKLDKELGEKPNQMDILFTDWLKKQNDEELLKCILEPKKTVQQAKQFAYNKANELQVGGCAIIEEKLAYLWITAYYKEPVIVLENKKETKKSKQKINRTKVDSINTVKEMKKSNQEKNKHSMMEGEQMDLLSFL